MGKPADEHRKNRAHKDREYRTALAAHVLGADDASLPPVPRKWKTNHARIVKRLHPEYGKKEIDGVISEIWHKIYNENDRKSMILKELGE